MKKTFLFLLTLFFCVGNWFTFAQRTVTVADGTNTEHRVPIFSSFLDAMQHIQTIYPENMLQDMQGDTIGSMTFYFSQLPSDQWECPFVVRLGTTNINDFAYYTCSFISLNFTMVYTGTLSYTTDSTLTINFTNPFVYQEGNLVLDIQNSSLSSPTSNSIFYGTNTNEYTSAYGYVFNENPSGPYGIRFIPKTSFGIIENDACPTPYGLCVTDIQSESATLSWTPNGNTNTWEVCCVSTFDEISDATWTIVSTDSFYTFTQLEANTSYIACVRSDCGTEKSNIRNIPFCTDCGNLTNFPFFEDFERQNVGGTSSHPLPSCWNRLDSTNFPHTYNSAATARNGVNSLRFRNNVVPSMAIFPKIDSTFTQIQNLELMFYAHTSSSSSNSMIGIGVMEDPADISTFTLIQTIIPTTIYQSSPYTVSFSAYEGDGLYIALCNMSTSSSYDYVYIDDIMLDYSAACERPNQITFNNIGETSVDISWSSTSESFNIYYKRKHENLYMLANSVPVSMNSYTLTGLSQNTTYDIYVAAHCADMTEAASNKENITTACGVFAVPYTEDFNNFNLSPSQCWSRHIGLASSVFNGASLVESNTGWIFNNNNVFPIGHPVLNIYGSAHSNWLISPSIQLQGLSNPILSFDMALTAWNSASPIQNPSNQPDDRFMVIISTDNGLSWLEENAILWNDTASGANYPFSQISHQPTEFIIPLSPYTSGTSPIRIAFYGESTVNNGDNDFHIANVSITDMVNTCLRPNAPRLNSVSAEEAVIEWEYSAGQASWEIAYGPYGFSPDSANNIIPVSQNSVTLVNLTPTCSYDVCVRAVCTDGGRSDWSPAMSFTTSCGTVIVTNDNAYTEDFSMQPNCWDLGHGNSQWPYNNNGYLFSAHSNYIYEAITPVLDIASLSNPYLRFSQKRPDFLDSGVADQLSLYIRPSEESDWIFLTSFNAVCPEWMVSSVPLPLASSYYQIKFSIQGAGNQAYGSFLDNIMIYNNPSAPSCIEPLGLTVYQLNSESVTLTWLNTGIQEYNLFYKRSEDSLYSIIGENDLNHHTYTLNQLLPATTYQAYMVTVCADNSTLSSPVICFTTACEDISQLPVTWDFESNNTGGTNSFPLPECWHRTGGNIVPYCYQSFYYAHSDSVCLFTGSKPDKFIAILPPVDTSLFPIHTLQIKFFARSHYGLSNKLEIGVMANPYNAASFTPLDSVTNISNTYTEYEITLRNHEGNSKYIALRFTAPHDMFYVDDIQLSIASSCPKPTNLAVINTGSTSATVSWDAGGEETSWEIEYGTSGFEPGSGTLTSVSTNPYSLNNLSSGNMYDLYVRASCGSSEYSEWTNPITFSTYCEAVSIPYAENFDNYTIDNNSSTPSPNYPHDIMPLCWTFPNRSTSASVYPNVFLTSAPSYAITGNCLFFRSSSTTPAYAVLPLLNTDIRNLQLMFSYRNESVNENNGTLHVGYMTDRTNPETFMNVYTCPRTASHIGVEVDFNTIQNESDTCYIAFKYEGGNFSDYYLSIDNIFVNLIPECSRPTNLAVTNTGAFSATLSWIAGSYETEWEIVYGERGFNPDSSANIISANANPFEITGLSPQTNYDFYIRALCSTTGLSRWSNPANATTLCDAISHFPYTEGFENGMSCWTTEIISELTHNNWTIGSTNEHVHSGNHYAYFSFSNNTSARLISPIFDFTNTPEPYVSFYHKQRRDNNNYCQDTLAVYYRTSDTTEWIRLVGFHDEISSYAFDSIPLPNPSATYQIAFVGYGRNGYGNYLDDITVDSIHHHTPPIIADTCHSPGNLQISGITQTSATVFWTNANEETLWNLQYQCMTANCDWGDIITTSNPSYTITDLIANTTYQVRVRAVCNDTVSEWTVPVDFTTLEVGIADLDFAQNISLMPNPADNYIELRVNSNVEVKEAVVYNAFGQTIQTIQLTENHARIDLSNMANGIYFVRVNGEGVTATKKFVKR